MSSGCCRLYQEGTLLLLSHYCVDLSPWTKPREGSFDLWRPAGRFTNIKFAFKGVDGATMERAAKATMPPRGGSRLMCVHYVGIYSVVG